MVVRKTDLNVWVHRSEVLLWASCDYWQRQCTSIPHDHDGRKNVGNESEFLDDCNVIFIGDQITSTFMMARLAVGSTELRNTDLVSTRMSNQAKDQGKHRETLKQVLTLGFTTAIDSNTWP